MTPHPSPASGQCAWPCGHMQSAHRPACVACENTGYECLKFTSLATPDRCEHGLAWLHCHSVETTPAAESGIHTIRRTDSIGEYYVGDDGRRKYMTVAQQEQYGNITPWAKKQHQSWDLVWGTEGQRKDVYTCDCSIGVDHHVDALTLINKPELNKPADPRPEVAEEKFGNPAEQVSEKQPESDIPPTQYQKSPAEPTLAERINLATHWKLNPTEVADLCTVIVPQERLAAVESLKTMPHSHGDNWCHVCVTVDERLEQLNGGKDEYNESH